jgi:hypothetical protein
MHSLAHGAIDCAHVWMGLEGRSACRSIQYVVYVVWCIVLRVCLCMRAWPGFAFVWLACLIARG